MTQQAIDAPPINRTCPTCGIVFDARARGRPGPPRKYCGPPCSPQTRTAPRSEPDREIETKTRVGRWGFEPGRRFGRLVALHHGPVAPKHYTTWVCACDCGGEIVVRSKKLVLGKVDRCSTCYGREAQLRADSTLSPGVSTGDRFGRLMVKERAGRRGKTPLWLCRCECGNDSVVRQTHLLRSDHPTRSCGGCRWVSDAGKFKAALRAERAARLQPLVDALAADRRLTIREISAQLGESVAVVRPLLPVDYHTKKPSKPPAAPRRWVDRDGYVKIGKEYEHRLVMSQHVGRPLRRQETVHHINGVKSDNRIENLELWDKSQPAGQRVADLVVWAQELLARHGVNDQQARVGS